MKAITTLFFLLAGLISANALGEECLRDNYGSVTCGFSCALDNYGHAHCAQTPYGACVLDNYGKIHCADPAQGIRQTIESLRDNYGQVVFGYHCMMDNYGHGHCAQTPSGTCMLDNYGKVTCWDPSSHHRGHHR